MSDGHLIGSTYLGRKISWYFQSLESSESRRSREFLVFQLSRKLIILSFLPSSINCTFDTDLWSLQTLWVADLDEICGFDSLQPLTLMGSS
jgi:hypothetical protein